MLLVGHPIDEAHCALGLSDWCSSIKGSTARTNLISTRLIHSWQKLGRQLPFARTHLARHMNPPNTVSDTFLNSLRATVNLSSFPSGGSGVVLDPVLQ